jgi:hypothetical protein
MLEALEAIEKDNLEIPARAMILSRKYRTLVSSWIEPLQEEAELGYEIDYIARYCFYYYYYYYYSPSYLFYLGLHIFLSLILGQGTKPQFEIIIMK